MDKLEKLFRKLSKKELETLQAVKFLLEDKRLAGLDIVKVKGTEWFRVRKGRLRVFFNYKTDGELQIKDVKTRDEKTYRDV